MNETAMELTNSMTVCAFGTSVFLKGQESLLQHVQRSNGVFFTVFGNLLTQTTDKVLEKTSTIKSLTANTNTSETMS